MNRLLKLIKRSDVPASFTVEASWIMGISLSIFCSLVLLGFNIFKETVQLAQESQSTFDAVYWFRLGGTVSDLISMFK